jgi:hypothetical protein
MHLWNDYEGTTIAGQWVLGRLLRTEGRSALFATDRTDGGGSAVLRLTEALNDQAVLGARYRAIQAAGDEFLVTVESYGDAEFDGTPLSYAVLEPTQETLAEILSGRRLGTDETQEVATNVAGGLLALHAQGLVHGLVEPESVVAAGQRIKLRSDCARPAPHGDEATLENAVTPQTDAFGLAGIIYCSLTQNRLHDAADALALPEPYATIVRKAARGEWGVGEIAEELRRPAAGASPVRPSPAVVAAPLEREVESRPLSSRAAVAPFAAAGVAGSVEREDSGWRQPGRVSAANRRGIAVGVAVLVLVLLLFAALHHGAESSGAKSSGAKTTPNAVSTPVAVPVAAPAAAAAVPAFAQRPAADERAAGAAASPGASPGQKVWRVIAYTYNRKAEAEAKAASLNRRFPGFEAAAWSRTGQRPFLVTLGGEMQEKQAFALRYRARKNGVAPDVYAQNYAR